MSIKIEGETTLSVGRTQLRPLRAAENRKKKAHPIQSLPLCRFSPTPKEQKDITPRKRINDIEGSQFKGEETGMGCGNWEWKLV